MCGRFALKNSAKEIEEFFGAPLPSGFRPRYNIAPGQMHPVLFSENGERTFRSMQWGLIPSWAEDRKIGYKMINARSETAAEKPSFRNAFKSRRAVIPASGFFEWKKDGRTKTPFYVSGSESALLGLAGIWEANEKGEPIETFSILTKEADKEFKGIHDRMPVLIKKEFFSRWIEGSSGNEIFSLLDNDAVKLKWHAVSAVVNSPANDTEVCIQKYSKEEDGQASLYPSD